MICTIYIVCEANATASGNSTAHLVSNFYNIADYFNGLGTGAATPQTSIEPNGTVVNPNGTVIYDNGTTATVSPVPSASFRK